MLTAMKTVPKEGVKENTLAFHIEVAYQVS
jgi:hypothetical protein